MTQGMLLEGYVQNYCTLNQIPCAHATMHEDRFKAIDLWIDGLPIQVTLGKWQTSLDIDRVKAKWDWTQFQSGNKAILCVFDMHELNKVTMVRNMVKGLIKMRRAGLATGIILINAQGTTIWKG